MKIKDSYKVRQMAGENLVVDQGRQQSDMTRIISLNSTALLLWDQLKGKDFSLNDAAQVLIDTYGIDPEQAAADAKKWLDSLIECHIIE